MKTIQQAIEVRVPVHTAYEQLSKFEDYPQFMTGVQEVRQVSDKLTHWVMDLDGQITEFDASITECTPDERVAWKVIGDPKLTEAITLTSMGADRTQITAVLSADANALLPSDAHAQESLTRRLKADLVGFKSYVEGQSGAQGRTGGAGTPAAGAEPTGGTRAKSAKGGARGATPGSMPSRAQAGRPAAQGMADLGDSSAMAPGGLAGEALDVDEQTDIGVTGDPGTMSRSAQRRAGDTGSGRA